MFSHSRRRWVTIPFTVWPPVTRHFLAPLTVGQATGFVCHKDGLKTIMLDAYDGRDGTPNAIRLSSSGALECTVSPDDRRREDGQVLRTR